MSGGLIAWGGHLGVVYAIATLACARRLAGETRLGLALVPGAVAVTTAIALALTAALLVHAWRDLRRREGERRFVSGVAAWVAAFSLVAIVWTALAGVLVEPPCAPRLGEHDTPEARPCPPA